jgi:amidase
VIPRVSKDDLDELARRWGFSIDAADADAYRDLLEGVLSVVDDVEPSAAPPPSRDAGRPPQPAEDPLNAVVRWCRVQEKQEGALAGMRVALKDSMALAGVPMTCGSRVLEGYVPPRDAVIVERLLAAGAEIVAITNMDDLAFSGGGDTSAYGATLCPFALERTAGGSSGGSAAALWYEGVDAGLGTDQGGSIRVPAAWCGIVGLKPTHGLVPYSGIVGIDRTFDHAGPMARSVEAAARVLDVIAPEANAAAAVAAAPADLGGIRLGVVTEGLGEGVGAQSPVVEALEAALERLRGLGAEIVERSLPEHLQAGGIAFAGFVEGVTALFAGGGNGFHHEGPYDPELALALREGLAERGDTLPPQVKAALLAGTQLGRLYLGAAYATAQNRRPELRAAHDRALDGLDALVYPTTPGLPHNVDPGLPMAERVWRGWALLANTYPTDMTGHPALSLPLAEAEGLPVGVMLVGRHGDDARLLSLGRTAERELGWRPDPAGVRARAAVPRL